MSYFTLVKFYGLVVLKINGINSLDDIGDYLHYPSWVLLAVAALGALAYLMGSINTAIIYSKLKYKDDIRKYGSGNAGMTNMMRVYGKGAGIVTIVGDLFKAVIPVFVSMILFGEVVAYFAGLCCIIGHAYPCYYGFKGGKGVMVTAATILTVEPILFAILFVVFLVIVLFTKYVSLGSIISALLIPVFMPQVHKLIYGEGANELLSFAMVICLVMAMFILFLHKENIRRLLNHEENHIEFKKKKKKE